MGRWQPGRTPGLRLLGSFDLGDDHRRIFCGVCFTLCTGLAGLPRQRLA